MEQGKAEYPQKLMIFKLQAPLLRGLPVLVLGGFLLTSTANAWCVRDTRVTGASLIGGEPAMQGWVRFIHATQVTAGLEAGPRLPDKDCPAVTLQGALSGRPNAWQFHGALSGGPRKALKAIGKTPLDWFSQSLSWLSLDKNPAFRLSEQERQAWMALAKGGKDRFLQERQALGQAVSAGGSSAARLELALMLQEINPDFVQAQKLLEDLHRENPKSYGAAVALGQLCLLIQDDACAGRALEKAIKLRPGILEAWGYLFVLAQGAGNLQQEIIALQGATKADPKNAFYLYSLAVALTRAGKLPEAMIPLKKAVNLNKNYLSQAKRDPDLIPLKRTAAFIKAFP